MCLCMYTCIHMSVFSHSFHKHWLSTMCVPGTVTGNKKKAPRERQKAFFSVFMGPTVRYICACVCPCEYVHVCMFVQKCVYAYICLYKCMCAFYIKYVECFEKKE